MGLQTVRDWVLRFNAEGPAGLATGKAPGGRSKLSAPQLQALATLIETGPMPALDGVVRWRLIDLAHRIFEEFGVTISPSRLSRIVRGMGYRKLSARPRHHAQAEMAIADFKKASPRNWRRSGPG